MVGVVVVLSVGVFVSVSGIADNPSESGSAGVKVDHQVTDSGNEAVTLTVVSSTEDVSYMVGNGDPVALGSAGDSTTLVEGVDYTSSDRITILSNGEVVQTVKADEASSDNQAPSADVTPSSATVQTGESITFDASGSSDPDGDSLTYGWMFGDGNTGTGETVTHSYSSEGDYTVEVTVDDGNGGTDTATSAVTVEAAAQVIGETGKVSVSEDRGDGTWKTLSFKNSYTDPVVIAKPMSYDGSDPGHIRVKEVTGTSAKLSVEEWPYLDGPHATVTVSYMVVDAGTYTLPDGTQMEVGFTNTDESFKSVSFSQSFGTTPVVFTQSQTLNGGDSIHTRNRYVSTTGFETQVEEQEANGNHAYEDIGYIALEPVTGTNNDRKYEVGKTPNAVTDAWYTIGFDQSYGTSRTAVLDMQTTDGGNTAGLRYDNFNSGSIDTFVEEEQSSDTETSHTDEVVGYWVFDSDGDIIAEK